MLKEPEETIVFFVTFLSLVAFQLGGPGPLTPLATSDGVEYSTSEYEYEYEYRKKLRVRVRVLILKNVLEYEYRKKVRVRVRVLLQV